MRTLRQLRRGTLPLLSGALAALAFQLAGPLHYVVVEHALCVEHGEAVHGGEHHDGHHHGVAVSHGEADEEGVRSSGEAEHGGHEHCIVAGRERDQLALNDASAPLIGFAQAATPQWVPQASARSSRPLEHAPKTSPPRLG